MQNIKEKVVVITGASSGLGEATARLSLPKAQALCWVRDGLNVSKHWLTS